MSFFSPSFVFLASVLLHSLLAKPAWVDGVDPQNCVVGKPTEIYFGGKILDGTKIFFVHRGTDNSHLITSQWKAAKASVLRWLLKSLGKESAVCGKRKPAPKLGWLESMSFSGRATDGATGGTAGGSGWVEEKCEKLACYIKNDMLTMLITPPGNQEWKNVATSMRNVVKVVFDHPGDYSPCQIIDGILLCGETYIRVYSDS